MNAPEPKPKRSRRMVVWLVVAPVVVLLLALAGANWKTFHLAYCKHLMSSTDPHKQYRGIDMVMRTQLRKGMPMEEVRRLLEPARVTEPRVWPRPMPPSLRPFEVRVEGLDLTAYLGFDEDDTLRYIEFLPDIPVDD